MLRRKNSFTEKNKIFYISPFMPSGEKYVKHISPAAQAKSDYIRSTIKDLKNVETVCINCSLTVDDSVFFEQKLTDENGKLRILFSVSSKNRKLTKLCGVFMLLSVLFFILFNIGKNDVVILYHSIYYDYIVNKLKKIKKYKIIYEVEEIYADVRDSGKGREKEIANCNKFADAFIFPTELLNEKINQNNKPNIIVYGAYKPNNVERRGNSGKQVIVYSGTLMKGKGADQSIDCAKGLDSNYEIRIIGYGSEAEINEIRKKINNNKTECQVVYDGLKFGKEYIEYLENCDIGLCIQPKENLFNETSFPSKILSYINAGLKVVATDMPALKKSRLSDYISFATDTSIESVVKAIEEAKRMNPPSMDILKELNEEVIKKIHEIINELGGKSI